ncbi:MAG: type II toxin-antitoxin system RelE/ParE family toxin [Tychonema bourrellyi B0820]|uniref:Plasmid stabilization protein n=1 Tax=Tychonema bourrellyi FEM_GT703 TaxID=2040638 RepID=A0A2G4F4W2_9CYAN|nr:type II toxin-antitoxin system RelE/ParE family toxin [Tychonema bourrellyi]MDQ2099172.1 type II toxin-antitoxin system RelE/ParE family toxin [Tychonema bourrellyi B0820]PHX56786.1 plasmid stabilization protein [Tychonema bourrellyi FEM_GT703]
MEPVEYQVILTAQARQLFSEIKDRREQQLLLARLEKLKQEPEKQGKALSEELTGYRSIRAVGQRYRIIYQIIQDRVLVVVVGIGRRKEGDRRDVYTVTMRLLVEMMQESDNDDE